MTANAENLPVRIEDEVPPAPGAFRSIYSTEDAFAIAQRQAKSLAASDLVPKAYQGNVANCLIALEAAKRTNSSALAVMQNMYVINGRPTWASQFVIGAINACGQFVPPLQFEVTGEGDAMECYAYAKHKDGRLFKGPRVTVKMAKAEGWLDRNGSKWKTMPDLMIRYRAAAFFGRMYAPEILLGMYGTDEVEDFDPIPSSGGAQAQIPEGATKAETIKAKLAAKISQEELLPEAEAESEKITNGAAE